VNQKRLKNTVLDSYLRAVKSVIDPKVQCFCWIIVIGFFQTDHKWLITLSLFKMCSSNQSSLEEFTSNISTLNEGNKHFFNYAVCPILWSRRAVFFYLFQFAKPLENFLSLGGTLMFHIVLFLAFSGNPERNWWNPGWKTLT